ncbi:MAG: ABC-2 family transporter protein [Lachnospiraceae bacterium]|nr:ABC-2 family transporter protein [Lachnospiraceae bacterium]
MVGKLRIKRYFELLGIYARMDLASLVRDTKFMVIAITADIVSNISSISGIFLLAWKFGGIGGMDRYEVLFMLAYGNIVMGFLNMMGGCNALFPSRIIGRGQWEHMFIMPLPYAVQLTVGIFPFTCSGSFLSGIALLCVAVCKMEMTLPWWWPGVLILQLMLSMVIVVAFSYLFSSLAFYAPVQCEEISSTVIYSIEHTMTFPLSGMPVYIRYPLLTIFPAGLTAWFPTMILLGKMTTLENFYPAVFALLISLAAAYFFRKGFRYYVQKGINRYVSGGHRA